MDWWGLIGLLRVIFELPHINLMYKTLVDKSTSPTMQFKNICLYMVNINPAIKYHLLIFKSIWILLSQTVITICKSMFYPKWKAFALMQLRVHISNCLLRDCSTIFNYLEWTLWLIKILSLGLFKLIRIHA